MQVADGGMVTALEKPNEGWGVEPGLPFEEGVYIWGVAQDPFVGDVDDAGVVDRVPRPI